MPAPGYSSGDAMDALEEALRFRAALILGVVAPGVAGCAVGPNYARPTVPMPESYYGAAAVAEARTLADAAWWNVFADPVLTALVEESLRNGFDARLAAARVEEARARFGIARADLLPSIDYSARWRHGRADRLVNPEGATQTIWTADVGLSWELDLWGRIRRLNEAARAQHLATEEARRGVLLSLASEVAVAYLDLRELDDELEITRRTAVAFRDTYDLFNRRLEGGTASALETTRAEAALGEVAAQIPEIERAIVARENRLTSCSAAIPSRSNATVRSRRCRRRFRPACRRPSSSDARTCARPKSCWWRRTRASGPPRPSSSRGSA